MSMRDVKIFSLFDSAWPMCFAMNEGALHDIHVTRDDDDIHLLLMMVLGWMKRLFRLLNSQGPTPQDSSGRNRTVLPNS